MRTRKKTKLETYAQSIRLSAAEKRTLRERVLSYVEYHPIRTDVSRRVAHTKAVPLEAFSYINFNSWALRPIAGVFVLIFVVGIPMLAERAIPGDILYPMKVRVNEEVQARLALSPYEKIAWNVERVERRVAEARLLAQEGKLTTEAEASLAVTLKEHTDSAAKSLAELRTTDANGAAVAQVSLESALEVQSAILASTIATGTDATSSPITGIAAAVQTAKDDVTSAADAALADAPLSYDKMSAQVESETTRAHELLSSVNGYVSADEKVEIDRRFADIDRAIVAAEVQHKDEHEAEAIDALKTTLGDTQKLIAFMTDIDVRGTVTLESLVPKKLTIDERIASINQNIDALKRLQTEIAELPAHPDVEIAAKINAGALQLPDMILDIETKRDQNNFDEADIVANDALALAADIKELSRKDDETPLPILGTSTPSLGTDIATNTASTTATSTKASSTPQ